MTDRVIAQTTRDYFDCPSCDGSGWVEGGRRRCPNRCNGVAVLDTQTSVLILREGEDDWMLGLR